MAEDRVIHECDENDVVLEAVAEDGKLDEILVRLSGEKEGTGIVIGIKDFENFLIKVHAF